MFSHFCHLEWIHWAKSGPGVCLLAASAFSLWVDDDMWTFPIPYVLMHMSTSVLVLTE